MKFLAATAVLIFTACALTALEALRMLGEYDPEMWE